MTKAKKVIETAKQEVGIVPQDKVEALNAMRNRAGQVLIELGTLEIRKAALVAEHRQLESQSQAIVRAEGERMGIPEGTQWRMTPDGKVTLA